MGSAIAGTIPGSFIGYLIASNLMKADVDPTQPLQPSNIQDDDAPFLPATTNHRTDLEAVRSKESSLYATFVDWLGEFKRGAKDANEYLATTESGSLIDFMDLSSLQEKYEDGFEPYSLGVQFGEHMDVTEFILSVDTFLSVSSDIRANSPQGHGYESFEEWLEEFKDGAGYIDEHLATKTGDGTSLIDLMDLTPLRRAYEEGVEPYELGTDFGSQFDIGMFLERNHGQARRHEDDDDDPPVAQPPLVAPII